MFIMQVFSYFFLKQLATNLFYIFSSWSLIFNISLTASCPLNLQVWIFIKQNTMHDSQSIRLNSYLTFDGNCEEAMNFYKNALKGELEIMRFEGSPIEVPYNYKQKVLHAMLSFGQSVLMASDNMPGQILTKGNNHAISVATTNPVEAEAIFEALSQDGHIIMPFKKSFWGALFGMFTDRFGMNWMVNCQLKEH